MLTNKPCQGGITAWFFTLSICACSSLPQDPTPAWDLANRYAMLIENDCNTVKRSVGLAGCAFRVGDLKGNLILPELWTGSVSGLSQNCRNLAFPTEKNSPNILQLADIYTATNKENCSWQLTRKFVDGEMVGDKTMKGRFFLKIMPDNENFKPLRFAIAKQEFAGVGWAQVKTAEPAYSGIPLRLTIRPSGTNGIFRMTCDGRTIIEQTYSTSPFYLDLQSKESCDYEMSARSSNSPNIDVGVLMHEVQKFTIDLTPPVVKTKSGKITFSFEDLDASGKDPVVVGVRLDSTTCAAKNKCSVLHNKATYFVQGFTLSARAFYGIYNSTTASWEIL